jgi:hypothetical protein
MIMTSAQLGHIILIPGQPVFDFTRQCCMPSRKVPNINFKVSVVWRDPDSNPQTTTIEASKVIITALMRPNFANYMNKMS